MEKKEKQSTPEQHAQPDNPEKIIEEIKIQNIIYNMDYTPYAIKRDMQIYKFCTKNNINVIQVEDYLLSKIGTYNKKNGEPYFVFTPFKNNGIKFKIKKPSRIKFRNLVKVSNFLLALLYSFLRELCFFLHLGHILSHKKEKSFL